jgi:hypothetical protein
LVEDVPTATPTPPPTSDPTDDPGNDILFLALARANAPKLEQAPDASVIELGKGVCGPTTRAGRRPIGANIALPGVMTIPQTGYSSGSRPPRTARSTTGEVAGIDATPNFMGCSTHSSAATSRPEG